MYVRKSLIWPVVLFVTMSLCSAAAAFELRKSLSKADKANRMAISGKIFAEVCKAQTGQFADDVSFFAGPAEKGRQEMVKSGEGLRFGVFTRGLKKDWAKHLSSRAPSYKITECKKKISFFRAKVGRN